MTRTGVLIGDNPYKLLFDDTRKVENLVKEYLDYQAEVRHLSPKTIGTRYDGIKQFYRSNRITLYGDSKDYVGSYSNIKSNVDMPYTYEEIHRILDKCDERKRVIVLLLCSTGMRRGAIPDLKVGDLKYIEEYGIYEITVYKGFPEEYKTFCSLECAAAINSYMDYRRRYGEKIVSDSYLIRKQFNREDPRHTGSDKVTISLPTDYRDSTRYKLYDISDGDGNGDAKSPNDKADLVEHRLKQLDIAIDLIIEQGLLNIFKERLGIL